ncbi:MAG: DNA primase [Lachnospiraceae bacterium]|jgi:DNA primase|nr:DNA primase [Lachnospiraceae bacterium]
MYYPDEIVEEITSKVDIVDLISSYVHLQKKGTTYFGLCPFHNEKTPSFSVTPSKQMFYCFGCGKGGGVTNFLMEYENYTFREAIEFLADKTGVTLPEDKFNEEQKERADKRAILLEINKSAANYYFKTLKGDEGEIARRYLSKRGLDIETLKKFGLGYAGKYGDGLYEHLKENGYDDDILMQAGLIQFDEKKGSFDRFWNRVMFPILDANKRVIGFGGRVLGEGTPKYLNSPETLVFDKSRNLYGLFLARRTRKDYFILAEGYMDVIALHQAGFDNAVASLGTSFTAGQANLMRRYVSEVIIAYDSDEAGTAAALRALPILKEAGINAKILRMEPYKDPDELIKDKGPDAFKERLDVAKNGFLFDLTVTERKYNLNTPDGKTAFLREAAGKLAQFEDEIERSNYTEAVARIYKVDSQDLRRQVIKELTKREGSRLYKKAEPLRQKTHDKEEGINRTKRILLTWMIEDSEILKKLSAFLEPEDFSGGLYAKVAELLFAQTNEKSVNPAKILNSFTDEQEQQAVAAMFHESINELSGQNEKSKALKDLLYKLKSHRLEEITAKTGIEGFQKVIEAKKELEKLKREDFRI